MKDLELVAVGRKRSDYWPEVQQIIAENKIENRVHFLENVTDNERGAPPLLVVCAQSLDNEEVPHLCLGFGLCSFGAGGPLSGW